MIAKIESGMNRVVSPFESLAHRYILAPFRYLLSKIDPLAKAIEGTMFKKNTSAIDLSHFYGRHLRDRL